MRRLKIACGVCVRCQVAYQWIPTAKPRRKMRCPACGRVLRRTTLKQSTFEWKAIAHPELKAIART